MLPKSPRPLRKGMTLAEVEAILGDNADDERGDGTLFTFETLVFDLAEGIRLASAQVWFRSGRATKWAYEVELVAKTWALIKAGDPPTLWAAGLSPEPTKEAVNAYIVMFNSRALAEDAARMKAERAAARKAGVPVAVWRARRRGSKHG